MGHVLAAYNAGEGKIRRLVAKTDAAGPHLPNVINRYDSPAVRGIHDV